MLMIFFQSNGLEGGMDSWMHFLNSKYAFKHPELFLDQWNKPVFTVITAPICQLGIQALEIFNIVCVALAGLLLSLTLRHLNYRNSWAVIPFLVFTPISFLNTVSGLTEPLAILMVALFVYLWFISKRIAATILAGFLPFIRTEGFVIGGAVLFLILHSKDFKLILWLFVGSIMMNFLGFIITGHPFWIITDNPYINHEVNGSFDPGSGSLFHFFHHARTMFGLPLLILAILSTLLPFWLKYKKHLIPSILSFALLGFWLYFWAHSLIYYFGILGSHGLTRPMALLAPFLALMAFVTFDYILSNAGHRIRIVSSALLVIWVTITAYFENNFPMPYGIRSVAIQQDRSQENFIKAGIWLQKNNLISRRIVHQSPFFNVYINKDPYDLNDGYWIWSIDKNADWTKDGTIIVWDGYSAKREGGMPLEWLQYNPAYKLLHVIDGEKSVADDPDRFDIYIFEKVPVN
jgi:hypothetical protein